MSELYAQWSLIPRDIDEEICKEMKISKQTDNIAFELGKMTLKDTRYYHDLRRDPLKVLFDRIREKKSEECPYLCVDPNEHFRKRICFPIYKVLQIIKETDSREINYYTDTLRQEVIRKIMNLEKSNNNDDNLENDCYNIYSLSNKQIANSKVEKSIILTIDFVNFEEFDEQRETDYYIRLRNLLENIKKTFKCTLSPQLTNQDLNNWSDHVKNQIDHCDFVILVLTPKLTEVLQNINEIFENKGDIGMDRNAVNNLNFLWNYINSTNKPLVSVIFDNDLENISRSMVSVLFQLPNDMRLLLGYLLHRLQDF